MKENVELDAVPVDENSVIVLHSVKILPLLHMHPQYILVIDRA